MIKKSLLKYFAVFSLITGAYLANPIPLGHQAYSDLKKASKRGQISSINNYSDALYDEAIERVKSYGDENITNLDKVRKLQSETDVHAQFNHMTGKIDYPNLEKEDLEKIIEAFE